MTLELSGFEGLTGSQWQSLCVRVLYEEYGAGDLIEVPDHDRGDAGIEAFTISGYVFQCYAPEGEPLTNKERVKRQKNKLDDSVSKFIKNAEKLTELIPNGVKVHRYVVLVPLVSSKDVQAHANVLTDEIRIASLPYASDGICVVVQTLNAYERARQAVIARQLTKLDLPDPGSLDYSQIEDPQVDIIHRKLEKTDTFCDSSRRDPLVARLLENFVASEGYKGFVFDEYPDLHEQLQERLGDLESRLTVQYPLEHTDPDALLGTVLADAESVVTDVLNTRDAKSRVLAEGQVADWLMRCPLDFRGGGVGDRARR